MKVTLLAAGGVAALAAAVLFLLLPHNTTRASPNRHLIRKGAPVPAVMKQTIATYPFLEEYSTEQPKVQ